MMINRKFTNVWLLTIYQNKETLLDLQSIKSKTVKLILTTPSAICVTLCYGRMLISN